MSVMQINDARLPDDRRYRIPDLAVIRDGDFEEKSLTRPPAARGGGDLGQ